MKRIAIAMLTLILVCTTIVSHAQVIAGRIDEDRTIKDYRQIPGVTQDEINKIEKIKSEGRTFTLVSLPSDEAFASEFGEIQGFAHRFSKLMEELYGIEVEHKLLDWSTFLDSFNRGEIDFTLDLARTEERVKTLYMTEGITERSLYIFYLADVKDVDVIMQENTPKFVFFRGSATEELLKKVYDHPYESIYVDSYAEAAQTIKSGNGEVFFGETTSVVPMAEYPFIQSAPMAQPVYFSTSLATKNPDLEPIISVMDKFLMDENRQIMAQIHEQGEMDYKRNQAYKQLTEEERAYIEARVASGQPISVVADSNNYPLDFYNTTEEEFQGMGIDVIKEIAKITGLDFKVINQPDVPWSELMDMIENGQAQMTSEIIQTEEREGRFLWSDAYTHDSFILASKEKYPEIKFLQIITERVGVIEKRGYQTLFQDWFPTNQTISYQNQDQAFEALNKGEIDLLAVTEYILLSRNNYYQDARFKTNVDFDYNFDVQFGFNKDEKLLASIVNKALLYANTAEIEEKWATRTFDYADVMERQKSIFLGSAIMLTSIIACLVLVLFVRSRNAAKHLEKLVYERTKNLEEATTAKSKFLARMSHESRTPLNVIIGMSHIIRKNVADTDQVMDGTRKILTSSEHLLGIINDILDMSKIESGKLTLNHEPFDLKSAVNEAYDIISPSSASKNIRIIKKFEDLETTGIIGDRLRLNQVLLNLLSNAIKFTKNGGEVSLTVKAVREENQRICIKFIISDTGIGMSDKQIDHLFIPFEQGSSSVAARYGGTGLGLAISQNLIKSMGGIIDVKSQLCQGSTFYFELEFPRAEMNNHLHSYDSVAAHLGKKRVLLVEDIDINREIIKEILAGTDIAIEEAVNGKEAVDMFKNSKIGQYTHVLMDIQMPVLNGYEATKQIRQQEREDAKTIRIIALTANAYKEDVEMALAAGMDMHLAKPVDIKRLIQVLED